MFMSGTDPAGSLSSSLNLDDPELSFTSNLKPRKWNPYFINARVQINNSFIAWQ